MPQLTVLEQGQTLEAKAAIEEVRAESGFVSDVLFVSAQNQ